MTGLGPSAAWGIGLGGFLVDPMVVLPGTEEAVAAMPGDVDRGRWAARLSELDANASAAEAAGDGSALAEARLAVAEHHLGVIGPGEVIVHFVHARAAFEGVDARKVADCTAAIAVCALASGDLGRAASGYAFAADEYDWLEERARWARARTDYATVVVQLGEFALAEAILHEVLRVSREVEVDADVLVEARLTLANVHGFSGRRDEAERALNRLRDDVEQDSLWHALCTESLGALHADQGDDEVARPEYERALRVYERVGHELRILESRAGLGWVLVRVGEERSGVDLLTATRRRFAELGRFDRVAACDYNLASVHVLAGRYEAADGAFEKAAQGLSRSGMHHQLANLQWNRAHRLMREARTEPDRAAGLHTEAIDTAISALIAADHERFQFKDVIRRVRWMRNLGHRMRKTFKVAYVHGSPQLVADLIESAINAGVYAVDADAAEDTVGLVQMDRGPAPFEPTFDEDAPAFAMGAAVLLSTPVLPLEPPPELIDGTGRVILGRQREKAAALDPELKRVLAAVPRVPIW